MNEAKTNEALAVLAQLERRAVKRRWAIGVIRRLLLEALNAAGDAVVDEPPSRNFALDMARAIVAKADADVGDEVMYLGVNPGDTEPPAE